MIATQLRIRFHLDPRNLYLRSRSNAHGGTSQPACHDRSGGYEYVPAGP